LLLLLAVPSTVCQRRTTSSRMSQKISGNFWVWSHPPTPRPFASDRAIFCSNTCTCYYYYSRERVDTLRWRHL
jgi:hypothetical protein